MMGLMTAQPPLPLIPAGAVPFGKVAALLQDDDGGRAFIRGNCDPLARQILVLDRECGLACETPFSYECAAGGPSVR
jgi:hypothetical protein